MRAATACRRWACCGRPSPACGRAGARRARRGAGRRTPAGSSPRARGAGRCTAGPCGDLVGLPDLLEHRLGAHGSSVSSSSLRSLRWAGVDWHVSSAQPARRRRGRPPRLGRVLEVVGQVGVEGDAVALAELVALPVADEHDGAAARRAPSRGCRARASAGRRRRRWRRPGASVWRESSARWPGCAAVSTSKRCPRRALPPRRRSPARTIVTAPPSSRRSSCESRSSRPAAIRAATVSVGLVSPRSTCESIGALTPLRAARSRSDSDEASRSAFTRAPMTLGQADRRSRRRSALAVCTVTIRAYVITRSELSAQRHGARPRQERPSERLEPARRGGRQPDDRRPLRERATATDSARTYARAAASMMSVETPWPAPVGPSTSTHDRDLAERVLALGDGADREVAELGLARPSAALIAWNTASIGPSPVNEPSA